MSTLSRTGLGSAFAVDNRKVRVGRIRPPTRPYSFAWTLPRAGGPAWMVPSSMGSCEDARCSQKFMHPDYGQRAPPTCKELAKALGGGIHKHVQLRQRRHAAHRETSARANALGRNPCDALLTTLSGASAGVPAHPSAALLWNFQSSAHCFLSALLKPAQWKHMSKHVLTWRPSQKRRRCHKKWHTTWV